jgi:predicted nucleic acid-binding protein
MILLDTNVLSALMQRAPAPQVVEWLDTQVPQDIWITTITVFEVRYGLNVLAEGLKRDMLLQRFEELVAQDLAERVVGLDSRAAAAAAQLAAQRKARGRPVDIRDTFIAGIASAQGAVLATRNTRHFADLTTPVVNPWGGVDP